MIIGVPKEIKDSEYRVGLAPAGVKAVHDQGITVLVEHSAGEESGITDQEYITAGAKIVKAASEVWARAQMIVKVKEPVAAEYGLMREGQIVFSYLHLAPDAALTRAMLQSKLTGIAFETITDAKGSFPLLIPMSEIAGRMAIQVGAACLERPRGGRGVLLAGVPGVPAGKVVIIGGGTVGKNAAQMAVGLGAQVTILDNDLRQLRTLDDMLFGRIRTLFSTACNIRSAIEDADLIIGAVLIPGGSAPKLISHDMLSSMQKGAVIVDVSADQGGCVETSHPTTHSNPTFSVNGVLHYCVTNMPGVVPRTSTFSLTSATLPYVLRLAVHGFLPAITNDAGLKAGVSTYKGQMTCKAVADSQGISYTSINELL